jgi:hypothetical protein
MGIAFCYIYYKYFINMEHKKIQFLVPQYKENEETISFLLDSIESQLHVDKKDIGVIICSDGGEYVLNAKYNAINDIYASVKTDANTAYSVLLVIVATVSLVLDLIVILDAMKHRKRSAYLTIPLSIITVLSFAILIAIRLLTNIVQIAVLANNITFIFAGAIIGLIWIAFVFKIAINRHIRKLSSRDVNSK